MKFQEYGAAHVLFERRVVEVALAQQLQCVLGLHIVYPFLFKANTQRARAVRATLLPDIASQLASLDVFDARGNDPITDVGVYRYRFGQDAALSLDQIAQGSAEHLICLDGVCNPRHAIRALTVSGLDARRISFSARRWNGKVGVEQLEMLEPGTQSLWAVRIAYAKGLPMHPLAAFALVRARSNARKILASIRLSAGQPEKDVEEILDRTSPA
jgi:hypothetical protein